MNPAIALQAVIPNETMPANLPIPLESGHTNGPPESPCKKYVNHMSTLTFFSIVGMCCHKTYISCKRNLNLQILVAYLTLGIFNNALLHF